MEIKEILQAGLKAVPVSFAGTVYEPWVQLLQFLFVASVLLSATVWMLTRPHMRAFAQRVWLLGGRALKAVDYDTRYTPAVERHIARLRPYVDLVISGLIGLLATLCVLFFCVFVMIGLQVGLWWGVGVFSLLTVFLALLAQFHWASMFWAWHSITTGEKYTWPRRRGTPMRHERSGA